MSSGGGGGGTNKQANKQASRLPSDNNNEEEEHGWGREGGEAPHWRQARQQTALSAPGHPPTGLPVSGDPLQEIKKVATWCPGAVASGHTETRRKEQITHAAQRGGGRGGGLLRDGGVGFSFNRYYSRDATIAGRAFQSAHVQRAGLQTRPAWCVQGHRNRERGKTHFEPHFLSNQTHLRALFAPAALQ